MTVAAALAAAALVSWAAFAVASTVLEEREFGKLWKEVEKMGRRDDGGKDEDVHREVS